MSVFGAQHAVVVGVVGWCGGGVAGVPVWSGVVAVARGGVALGLR